MAEKYSLIHRRKNVMEALFSGRGYRDWYVAQASGLFGLGWRPLKICPTVGRLNRPAATMPAAICCQAAREPLLAA